MPSSSSRTSSRRRRAPLMVGLRGNGRTSDCTVGTLYTSVPRKDSIRSCSCTWTCLAVP
jgi:hypothetical protein